MVECNTLEDTQGEYNMTNRNDTMN